tara:strand:- start:2446 stop:2559 length:114 start_codon:yes stop_codon:yes gene_type:complete
MPGHYGKKKGMGAAKGGMMMAVKMTKKGGKKKTKAKK